MQPKSLGYPPCPRPRTPRPLRTLYFLGHRLTTHDPHFLPLLHQGAEGTAPDIEQVSDATSFDALPLSDTASLGYTDKDVDDRDEGQKAVAAAAVAQGLRILSHLQGDEETRVKMVST